MRQAPQFGAPEAGRVYPDRPAAFGLAERDGKIALVRVKKEGSDPWLDLPGGALDPGETAETAVAREFGEEAGLVVEARGAVFAQADQYFLNTEGKAFNNRGAFFDVAVLGVRAELKVEDDHTLVWLDPHEALASLRHDAHAWAVAAWLRARARSARIATARGSG
jgi:8-oxo-dGTP diphosphatase